MKHGSVEAVKVEFAELCESVIHGAVGQREKRDLQMTFV